MTDHVLAASVEAEQAVLCSLLSGDAGAADDAFDLLRPEEFSKTAHAKLFEAMRHLHAVGSPIDAVVLRNELDARGDLKAVGGLEYLAYLLDVVPNASNLAYHAGIVRDRALERRLIDTAHAIHEAAAGRTAVGEQLAAHAEALLFEATDRASIKSAVRSRDLMVALHDVLEQRAAAQPEVLGIGTGLASLDAMTGGWRDGNLILVAARPGEGKSSLALHLAQHAATTLGIPTVLFSLEMTAEECGMRLIASEALVDLWRLERGRLFDGDVARIARATDRIARAPLFIDDVGERTISSLRAAARRLYRREGVRFVLVDYGQLLSGDERAENRTQEMSAVSRGLKALAKQLAIPVVVCCQLNRAKEQRAEESRPRLSDLRETGQWEQDAHVVVFPWRAPGQTEHLRTLIVAKQRNGPKGDCVVHFSEQTGRWEDEGHQVAAA